MKDYKKFISLIHEYVKINVIIMLVYILTKIKLLESRCVKDSRFLIQKSIFITDKK